MASQLQDLFYIENEKVILKEQGSFPAREIGEIKSSEEETIQYFIERYERLKEKVEEVNKLIEEQDNKGSFLQKVLKLREEIKSYDGLGDFVALDEHLKNLQSMLEDYVRQNRKRNLEVKNILIEEAKSYASNPNWKEATEELKELRQRWIKVGAVEKDKKQEVEDGFQAVYDDFYERKKAFHDARMQMMDSRINQYEQLIERAAKINGEEKLKAEEKNKQTSALVEEWKSLENIPKERYDELLKQFKKLTHSKNSPKGAKPKNTSNKEVEKKKKELLESLKLAKELPVEEATEKAKAIQAEWKDAGKAPMSKEINETFFYLMDYIFERDFIERLFSKKVKDTKDEKAALKVKMNILRDLIHRDKKELLIFEENMGKFTLDSAKVDKIVGFKLEKQKRKLAVKQDILAELQENYKKL